VRLLGFWFVVVGFMLVSGVLFSGGLNPGAMFVSLVVFCCFGER
jgi:hypothetical protein